MLLQIAVLAMRIVCVRQSSCMYVCQTRVLWLNDTTFRPYPYTRWQAIPSVSLFCINNGWLGRPLQRKSLPKSHPEALKSSQGSSKTVLQVKLSKMHPSKFLYVKTLSIIGVIKAVFCIHWVQWRRYFYHIYGHCITTPCCGYRKHCHYVRSYITS